MSIVSLVRIKAWLRCPALGLVAPGRKAERASFAFFL
jgi:hypothetical protein